MAESGISPGKRGFFPLAKKSKNCRCMGNSPLKNRDSHTGEKWLIFFHPMQGSPLFSLFAGAVLGSAFSFSQACERQSLSLRIDIFPEQVHNLVRTQGRTFSWQKESDTLKRKRLPQNWL
ncbi:MAG: hypothetical protein IJP07_03195 [Firmicutes bacterium]|nr:hypothetical protein [Bacillota bacterium]